MSTWSFDPLGNAMRAERERQIAGHQLLRQVRAAQRERAKDAATVRQSRVRLPVWQRVVGHLRAVV